MSPTYNATQLEKLQIKRTPFTALESYVTFYRQSDFPNTTIRRSAVTPVGTYLFVTGWDLSDITNMLPVLQAFGSKKKNLTAAESVECKLTISGLMVPIGDDVTWMDAGHTPLLAFIDLLTDVSANTKQPGDVLNSLSTSVQTIAVWDLLCISKRIAGADVNLMTFNLDFIGSTATYLPLNQQELAP